MQTYTKEVKFDRASKGFNGYINGELATFGDNRQAVADELDTIVYELLAADADVEASVVEEIAKPAIADALLAAMDDAEAKAQGTRWENATRDAIERLHLMESLTWHTAHEALIVPSATGNGSYTSNGVCQCRAFELGKPCHHRAMARIVRNALQLAS
jgi:hypothetical protein